METRSQTKSKLKRQRDDNGSDQRKSQRLALSAKPERTTKIIDVNDDCLVKIFGHLDLQNLFNVAVANEYLRPAARDVFERKFGTKMVEIRGCHTLWNAGSISEGYGGVTLIYGLKSSLQFLRCFGSSLSNLSINYEHSNSKRYEYVHQYISDYCAASLNRIEFWGMPTFKAEPFQKAFVNVREIVVAGTILEQHLQSFAKWFPNLTRLNLEYNQSGESFVAHSFQRLEHLRVVDFDTFHQNKFFADLLRGAHQLKCLGIETLGQQNFPIDTLLDMIEDKPLLAELKYNSSRMQEHPPMPVSLEAVQRIIEDHPALIEIILPQFQFTRHGINALTDQLKSLNKFSVAMQSDDFDDLSLQLKNEWNSSEGVFYYNNRDFTIGTFFRRSK